jgi:oligoendopeptidase F
MNDTIPSSPLSSQENRYLWDIDSIFPDRFAWRRECDAVQADAKRAECFRGTLDTSPEHLYRVLTGIDALEARLSRVVVYARLLHAANTRDDATSGMQQQVDTLASEVGRALSFVEPELIAIGYSTLQAMMESFEPLKLLGFYFAELERSRAHILPADQEGLLTQLSVLGRAPEAIRDAVHDGDMRFASVRVGGEVREVNHGVIEELLQHPDRTVRSDAYISYTDGYLRNPKALTATLTWQATTSLAFAKVRKHRSTFERALFKDALPQGVYRAALSACREYQPLFQRYFRARAKILGIPKICEFDIHAPLSTSSPQIPYERGVSLVLGALAPLGEEYVSIARQGLTSERWVHVFPTPGKYSNAFSSGAYGTAPFFLLNYAPTMPEVGTLAHELGHSMHSYFTNRAQPFRYSSYAMTVAETASNLNQVLLRAHVLKEADRDTTLAVLDEAFFFAHRYLFMMPILSRVEHVVHSLYARGGALGASNVCKATVTAFASAYGDSVEYEPERLGMKWGHFCHFFAPYYLFQYSIGISAAMAIGKRILEGSSETTERYLEFLSAGASMPTVEIFKIVGVDIASPQPYRDAFSVVEGYVEQLERLIR